jgi:hypothetical protein
VNFDFYIASLRCFFFPMYVKLAAFTYDNKKSNFSNHGFDA